MLPLPRSIEKLKDEDTTCPPATPAAALRFPHLTPYCASLVVSAGVQNEGRLKTLWHPFPTKLLREHGSVPMLLTGGSSVTARPNRLPVGVKSL